jgi:signal-transduction protein with cAMP-binding, CBS, and nucleotidyltransferase domain
MSQSSKPSQFGAIAISPSSSAVEAYETMRRLKIHHLVVSDSAKILGILSDRDLFEKAYRFDLAGFDKALRVKELMTANVASVESSNDIRSAMQIMRATGASAVPVVDGGRAVGLITESDLMELLGKLQEESGQDSDSIEGFFQMLVSHPLVQSTMRALSDIGI